ncbi:FBD-associated F-box protein [Rhynchospora pubera]|uniref:FBD-associated F-box protein n=1 Tax=Rhynchospora pubera TaxID=906938 RepID=A0AAV8BS82_9POAL|nr:FBD-associated F-box protein [Rhynchospora pubera]
MERGSASKSKRRPKLDYISSMPDPILIQILSLLETHEAVRTCILSKRWTTLWTSLTSLSFNFLDFRTGEALPEWDTINNYWDEETWLLYYGRLETEKNDQNRFAQFLNMMLHRREPCDLHNFYLSCTDSRSDTNYSDDDIVEKWIHYSSEWIQYALRHNVRKFHFSTRLDESVPTCMFDCSSLERLHLEIYENSWYHSKGNEVINLPNLKELYLKKVALDASLSKRLFSGCPALEDLCLEECPSRNCHVLSNKLKRLRIISYIYWRPLFSKFVEKENFFWRISAPNLISLTFMGKTHFFHNTIFENTTSLINLHVYFTDLMCTDKNIYESFSSVKDLEIKGRFYEELFRDQVPKLQVFRNVERFLTGGFCFSCQLHSLTRILEHLPNLKKLTLEHNGRYCCWFVRNFDLMQMPLHNGEGEPSARSRSIDGGSSTSSSTNGALSNSSKNLLSINCKNLSEIKVKYLCNDGSVKRLLDSLLHSTMELPNIKIISFPLSAF